MAKTFSTFGVWLLLPGILELACTPALSPSLVRGMGPSRLIWIHKAFPLELGIASPFPGSHGQCDHLNRSGLCWQGRRGRRGGCQGTSSVYTNPRSSFSFELHNEVMAFHQLSGFQLTTMCWVVSWQDKKYTQSG